MEWTEDTIQRLRALWQEGHSTAEIGRRMGISKNAVVGKAHRLQLPARPSPIRRESAPRAPRPVLQRPVAAITRPVMRPDAPQTRPVAVPATTRPAVAANVVSLNRPAPQSEPRPPVAIQRPDPFDPGPQAEARAERAADRSARRLTSCCWPLGEPGTKAFRFCGCETVPGKPYCLDHAQLAYVRIKDRRESVA